jgi:hypothetical protein
MSCVFRLFILAAAGLFATNALAETLVVDTPACKECGLDGQDSAKSHREEIRAARARYDRENEKAVARPWDAMKNHKPSPDKNK